MSVVAVIVTFNNEDTIKKCISSLSSNSIENVILVDNASTDATLTIVRKHFKDVEVIENRTNCGYAGGNNIGIQAALDFDKDYVLVLNPDTRCEHRSIDWLVKSAESFGRKGLFGPKFVTPDLKNIWGDGGYLDKNRYTAGLKKYNQKNSEEEGISIQDYISGTCMLIPSKLLKTGLRFFEPYFLYFEDVEFCYRAGQQGYSSYTVAQSVVVHSEESRSWSMKNYYLARNHLLFIERNAPKKVIAREIIRLPKTFYEHIRSRDRNSLNGIRDYFFRSFGRYH